MDDLLLRGIAAARAGRRSEARALLLQMVEQDERNEQAWLWLSGVMDDPEDVRTCLENVLELNPNNARARQGLEWLNARSAPQRAASMDRAATPGPEARAADAGRQTPYDPLEAGAAQSRATAQQRVAAEPARPAAPTAAQAPATGATATAAAKPTLAPAAPRPAGGTGLLAEEQEQNPCPYCGAPTGIRQRTCLKCRRSLMVQLPPSETPSRWLGWLATTWLLPALALALAGLALFAAALLAYQAARFSGPGGEEVPNVPFPLGLVTAGTALLVLGGAAASIGRALRRRALPAYYAAVLLTPLALVLGIFLLLRVSPADLLQGAGVPAQEAGLVGAALTGLIAALVVAAALAALLGAAAYRDFFGPLERFVAVVQKADPTTHYNNGVAYKNRGMWYMAAREWEEAVARAPRDINYLRALGLAYAQLGRFDPAREMLDRALQLAPGHTKLAEDRALIDRLAAEAQRR